MQETIEIKVFISCPGDVTPEKEEVIRACKIVTDHLIQRDSRYRYRHQDFREIYAPLGSRAQDEINTRFSDYDIYIGILWMKFGTPTGAMDPNTGLEYNSGTFEEFSLAKKRKQDGEKLDIFLFFKDVIKAKNETEEKQLKLVQEFKREAQRLGWTNKITEFPMSFDFYDSVTTMLHKWVADLEKTESITKKNSFVKEKNDSKLSANSLEKFINECPPPQITANRGFNKYSTSKNIFSYFEKEESKTQLNTLVLDTKRIVLLGNPGSGKSTELYKLVHHFTSTSKDTPLIPVYKKLNTYVDESIENILPKDWETIPSDICIIILDGLDEIQSQNYNTAIRKIQSFSDKNPEIRLLISCRTNFYEFPEDDFAGTLPNFEVYLINDLDINSIKAFAYDKYQIDSDEFIAEVYRKDLHQLIIQPFFLEMLLQEYKKENHLIKSKAELLDSYIEKRFIADQIHFITTINLKRKKNEIVKMLQRVALAMEYLGRNFIEDKELLTLIPPSDGLSLLKHSTAFNALISDNQKWAFEHNNIQEFLAANSLLTLSTEQIKKLISFNNTIVKPSWVNTLFFYIGIVDKRRRQEVLNWLKNIDPQMLVRIDPDKVDEETRTHIFLNIFNDFKEKDLWINSNKFSAKDLAHFASSKDSQEFLINEFESDRNSNRTKLNAIYLLQDFSVEDIEEDKLTASLLICIKKNIDDPYIVHAAIITLLSLSLLNNDLLDELFEIAGEKKHQYTRSALYKAISELNLADHYLDYLTQGLNLKNNEDDRDDTNLFDESYLLKESISKLQNIYNVIEVFESILDNQNRDSNLYYGLPDILDILVNKAVTATNNQNDIFSSMLDIYKKSEVRINQSYAKGISQYFIKTKNEIKAHEHILKDNSIDSYDKEILLIHLTTEAVVKHTVDIYLKRDLTNQDIQNFYDILKLHNNNHEFRLLKEILIENQIPIVDRREELQERERIKNKENFKLYFNPSPIKTEIEEFFKAYTIVELSWSILWDHYKTHHESVPDQDGSKIHQVTFDLLADLTRDQSIIDLKSILDFVEDTNRLENYLFLKLEKKVKNTPQLTLNKLETEILKDWIDRTLSNQDITKAIKIQNNNPHHFTIDESVNAAWFFVTKYNLSISREKLLDFTLFHNWKEIGDSANNFTFIEEHVGSPALKKRVQQNIENGIHFYATWQNNAFYVIEKKIKGSYSKLTRDFADSNISIHSRKHVVIEFIRKIGKVDQLPKLLERISEEELRSTIIRELIKIPRTNKELKEYLLKVLKDSTSPVDDKITVSQFLTLLREANGTRYYLAYLKEMTSNTDFDSYSQTNYIKAINDIKYLPKLIEIMEKAYLNPHNASRQEGLNSLEGNICDALYHLGLISEEYLAAVSTALTDFINRNISSIMNINEFYPMIERMNHQFYVTKSQNVTIYDAIEEVDKILNFKIG